MKKIISVILAMSLLFFTFPINAEMLIHAAEIGVAMTDSQGAGQTIPDGDYWIYSSLSPYYYLDVPGNIAAGGDNVQMWQQDLRTKLADWDTWTLTYLGNGYYSIKQKGTNVYIDVTDASLDRGTNVQMCANNGSAAQQWSIIPNGEGFNIKSKCNSMMLDVTGGNVAKNTNVYVWEDNGGPAQLFYLVNAQSPFKGSGTKDDPYQISSSKDLQTLSNLVNSDATCNPYNSAYYIQTANIDLENELFTPIGTYTETNTGNGFKGYYNGNQMYIRGLNVNRSVKGYDGLFGWLENGYIENLVVYGNVSNSGVRATGGIVGEINDNSTIKNCAFIGSVKCDQWAGGIVGSQWQGSKIESCYFNGDVISNEFGGGIAGRMNVANNSDRVNQIINCYAVGQISAASKQGGILGGLDTRMTSSNINVNGCYYLNNMTIGLGETTVLSGCKDLTDSALRGIAYELGTPFVDNDNENLNDGYPVFEWQNTEVPIKQNVSSGFKGKGTEEDPYQISSAKDLNRLAELINDESTNPLFRHAYYIQTADIDLNNEDFTPIGIYYGINGTTTSNAAFAGNYDGNYHSIKNLSTSYSNDYCGLFGRVGEYNYDNTNCEIKNLSVSGSVECYSDSAKVGGIIGELAYGATIKNCDYHGSVTANGKVGSIAGSVYCGGTISACYSDANIFTESADSASGGIVGEISVGDNEAVGSASAKVESTYYNGTISSNNIASTGAICGNIKELNGKTITFETNFFLSSSFNGGVANAAATGCTKLSEVALKACADMIGSPYITNDNLRLNKGYPVFEWQSEPYEFLGSGTAEDPYQISTKTELEQMRSLVNSDFFNKIYGHAHFIQMADIDLENETWIPIGIAYDKNGNYTADKVFYGTYNGNGKYIRNLNADTVSDVAGLFGVVDGAESAKISNLVVYGAVPSTSALYGGAIAGKLTNNATIDGCGFVGNINLSSDSNGTISAGGIVGIITNGGTITNCYHNGAITSSKNAGGILGTAEFTEADTVTIENCYQANGTISGNDYANSIVGNCIYANSAKGKVNITNCYCTNDTGTSDSSKNASSDNTLTLSKSLLKKAFEDLGSKYVENTDSDLNNGYPVYKWQLFTSTLKGDVNGDGEFNVADVVCLQRWLLADKRVVLNCWKNGDLCSDERIDVFDLCLMKRELVLSR